MFVTAGARSNFLLEREISLQFQLQTLASAQYRVQATLDKVYMVAMWIPIIRILSHHMSDWCNSCLNGKNASILPKCV